jgi:hypothetical protein
VRLNCVARGRFFFFARLGIVKETDTSEQSESPHPFTGQSRVLALSPRANGIMRSRTLLWTN